MGREITIYTEISNSVTSPEWLEKNCEQKTYYQNVPGLQEVFDVKKGKIT